MLVKSLVWLATTPRVSQLSSSASREFIKQTKAKFPFRAKRTGDTNSQEIVQYMDGALPGE